jgi:hypothetical protein
MEEMGPVQQALDPSLRSLSGRIGNRIQREISYINSVKVELKDILSTLQECEAVVSEVAREANIDPSDLEKVRARLTEMETSLDNSQPFTSDITDSQAKEDLKDVRDYVRDNVRKKANASVFGEPGLAPSASVPGLVPESVPGLAPESVPGLAPESVPGLPPAASGLGGRQNRSSRNLPSASQLVAPGFGRARGGTRKNRKTRQNGKSNTRRR